MSELRQQGYEWTVTTGRERPRIQFIHEKLMEKRFSSAQLISQTLINSIMQDDKKYDLAISKAVGIFFKLVSDQHQPIIKGKIPEKVWNILQ